MALTASGIASRSAIQTIRASGTMRVWSINRSPPVLQASRTTMHTRWKAAINTVASRSAAVLAQEKRCGAYCGTRTQRTSRKISDKRHDRHEHGQATPYERIVPISPYALAGHEIHNERIGGTSAEKKDVRVYLERLECYRSPTKHATATNATLFRREPSLI